MWDRDRCQGRNCSVYLRHVNIIIFQTIVTVYTLYSPYCIQDYFKKFSVRFEKQFCSTSWRILITCLCFVNTVCDLFHTVDATWEVSMILITSRLSQIHFFETVHWLHRYLVIYSRMAARCAKNQICEIELLASDEISWDTYNCLPLWQTVPECHGLLPKSNEINDQGQLVFVFQVFEDQCV